MFGKEQGEHVNGENGELQKNGKNLQDWPGKWPFYKMEVCEKKGPLWATAPLQGPLFTAKHT